MQGSLFYALPYQRRRSLRCVVLQQGIVPQRRLFYGKHGLGLCPQHSAVQGLDLQDSTRELQCQLQAFNTFARELLARSTAKASAWASEEAACSSSVYWYAGLQ